MTQQQLDYLCINQQSAIGLRSAKLVDFAQSGDISAPALAANIMASHSLMKAIKDYDIDSDYLTDEELFSIQDKLLDLEGQESQFYE